MMNVLILILVTSTFFTLNIAANEKTHHFDIQELYMGTVLISVERPYSGPQSILETHLDYFKQKYGADPIFKKISGDTFFKSFFKKYSGTISREEHELLVEIIEGEYADQVAGLRALEILEKQISQINGIENQTLVIQKPFIVKEHNKSSYKWNSLSDHPQLHSRLYYTLFSNKKTSITPTKVQGLSLTLLGKSPEIVKITADDHKRNPNLSVPAGSLLTIPRAKVLSGIELREGLLELTHLGESPKLILSLDTTNKINNSTGQYLQNHTFLGSKREIFMEIDLIVPSLSDNQMYTTRGNALVYVEDSFSLNNKSSLNNGQLKGWYQTAELEISNCSELLLQ